jgi:hypothetical protein
VREQKTTETDFKRGAHVKQLLRNRDDAREHSV